MIEFTMYNFDHAVITISNYLSASKQPTQKPD